MVQVIVGGRINSDVALCRGEAVVRHNVVHSSKLLGEKFECSHSKEMTKVGADEYVSYSNSITTQYETSHFIQ